MVMLRAQEVNAAPKRRIKEECLSIILPTDSTGLGLVVFDKGISQSMNGTSRQLAMLQYTIMPS